jgi:hypothetical protein
MRTNLDHWAYAELENKLTAKTAQANANPTELHEFGTFFLINPALRHEIDGIIHRALWPAVIEGVAGSRIRIYQERKALSQIRDTRSPELSRELTFLLEDPQRAIGDSNRPPWYVRGTLEGRPFTYMLKFDLILELPITFDLFALLSLMAHQDLGAMPPTLSVDHETYSVQFSWGRGGPYAAAEDGPEIFITDAIVSQLEIIDAMEELEEANFENEVLFERLTNSIVAFYGN